MKIFAFFTLFCLVAGSAFAATGKEVSYPSGDETVHGVLYQPKKSTSEKLPAIIVIHEWWGLNDWVKEQAQRFADQGYVTLAIDLYRGKVATTPEEAHEIMRGVPEDRANRDLLAAVDYVKSLKNVDSSRIGGIGWCMGGGYALDLAVLDPSLKAVVINYGHLASDNETLQKIHAAVLGIFGAKDRGIPPESVREFEKQMKDLGKDVQVFIYPHAGHAFENPNNKAGYRAQDANDAYEKQTKFFAEKLKQ